jgi:hypothetical protein
MGLKKPPPGRVTKTRQTARVVVREQDTGVEHVIEISAPKTFFGLWRVTQRKPRRSARVQVGCGADGRIKYKWNKGAKDTRTQGAMIAAVNQAVAWISGAQRRKFGRVCQIAAAAR